MKKVAELWQRWVAFCARTEDPRPQALLRILLPWMILLDLGRVAQLGLLDDYFVPFQQGGINRVQDSAYILGSFLPPETAGLVGVAVAAAGLLLASLGLAYRPALLIGILAYAQVGHLYSPGDRAIDRILRTVLLIWAFSDAHRFWSLNRAPRLERIAAWPADLARYLLVIIYLSAGLGKLLAQPAWLAVSGTPVLYRVMTDPLAAHMDPITMQSWTWPLRIMGWGTILLELSVPLVFTRFAPYWAIFGVGMHLGIFYTMDLGMFSWGMLDLYPLFFERWITGRK